MNFHRATARKILRPPGLLFMRLLLPFPTPAAAQATAAPPPAVAPPPRQAAPPAGADAEAPRSSVEDPGLGPGPRVGEIDQRLRILERRWEVEQDAAAAKKTSGGPNRFSSN